MAKVANRYYQVDPWKIIEKGFDQSRALVSESIFSLGNEYMGVRGFFDEGFSGNTLIGTYFNGVYEIPDERPQNHYKGISDKVHFMVNSVNFYKTTIYINDVLLDLNENDFTDFTRELSLKTGELIRRFVYKNGNTEVMFTFRRLLDMKQYQNAFQVIEIKPLMGKINLKLVSSLDYSIRHWGQFAFWKIKEYHFEEDGMSVVGETSHTGMRIATRAKTALSKKAICVQDVRDNVVSLIYQFSLDKDEAFTFEKQITNLVLKDDHALKADFKAFTPYRYREALQNNQIYFDELWWKCDIEIHGDELNQQGIRFCIFNLMQTYQGINPSDNIGAKGLTGEAYSGQAFWDTETYCLPFYLFQNPQAAKNLLMFRYNTLKQAKERALELDCKGACYPIATLNGQEGCNLWQHASLQFQPTTAVCYGIWHYVRLTRDLDFLYRYGLEILIEASRFLASRGDWNHDRTHFGFYGVMGPDEFQMMVNHNTYTNYMAQKTFEYTLEVLSDLQKADVKLYQSLREKLALTDAEISDFREKAAKMLILYDPETKLFEQHDGYFDLPHVDINKIPVTDFPLYSHWSYDRIYRNDMIKQPDVLMFMLLHNSEFTLDQKKANYEFYEPRTIHESSLSPSVHSILAAELGKMDEALKFFGFATRMDLDDYNRNASEGLHLTSIAAAWVTIVYGFGGLRSDGDILKLSPTLPEGWEAYQFKIVYLDSRITVNLTKDNLTIEVSGNPVTVRIYDEIYVISDSLTLARKPAGTDHA